MDELIFEPIITKSVIASKSHNFSNSKIFFQNCFGVSPGLCVAPKGFFSYGKCQEVFNYTTNLSVILSTVISAAFPPNFIIERHGNGVSTLCQIGPFQFSIPY